MNTYPPQAAPALDPDAIIGDAVSGWTAAQAAAHRADLASAEAMLEAALELCRTHPEASWPFLRMAWEWIRARHAHVRGHLHMLEGAQ